MGVFMLVAIPVAFIALLAGFLIWTIRQGEQERNK
ncbi:hypothetical protein B0I24_104172 [Aliidiomarina maris]|uniref:Uncharacterized protein n=1 Tax=Aliidiomarina maris TaxID=531312 RepID=A0A327X1A8_9GAMM|nr:hypothetical protein B0I24_104172 [Aliidiomarina maris]